MKLVNIVGARPQFIKLAPVIKTIDRHNSTEGDVIIQDVLVHTGQHYDYEMSQVFFEDLGLKTPDYHLGVGSGTHGYQTGEMLKRIEKVLIEEKPDMVVVYGDTNTTLAGALAAAKLHIPIAHVEAGLRSFNREMPEEHNRVLTDHCSDILFCPSTTAVENLRNEGFTEIINGGRLIARESILPPVYSARPMNYSKPLVVNVGDVMYDAMLLYSRLAEEKSVFIDKLGLSPKEYVLATLHRAEIVDNRQRLTNILQALEELSAIGLTVILPVHPRTKRSITTFGIKINNIRLIEPISYLDMLMLEKHARVILTDSGGVQKEAFFLKVPCVTLREETEWVETVEAGWNVLAGFEPRLIVRATLSAREGEKATGIYGDGFTSERVFRILIQR